MRVHCRRGHICGQITVKWVAVGVRSIYYHEVLDVYAKPNDSDKSPRTHSVTLAIR